MIYTGLNDLNTKNNLLVDIIHQIIKIEYEKYRTSRNIDKVLLSKDELLKLLNKYEGGEELLKKMIDDGLIIQYIVNGERKYRSIYFDVIQDYVGIKETKLGKPTVFEYKVLEPRMENLPRFNVSCHEVFENTWKIVRSHLPRDIDESLYQAIQQILRGIACLHDKYSNMQKDSIVLILDRMFKRAGEGVIVSAPTGWGKTEAFIIPILIYSIIQKLLGRKGVKAILIYPRKALASNQVKRIIEYYVKLYDWFKNHVKGIKIDPPNLLPTIAIRDGQSKSPSDYVKNAEFRIRTVKITPKRKEAIKYSVLVNDSFTIKLIPVNRTGDAKTYVLPITNVYFELFGDNKVPDIIVTNLDTFNRMLSTPRFNLIWKKPDNLACIVYDEAHVYDKSNLVHLIYIIRRTRVLIKELSHKLLSKDIISQPLMIFSSATLHKEFEDIVREVLDTTIHRITHETSRDPKRVKLELVAIIAPRPNVAGQWIAQLIGLYNVAHSISKAIKTKSIELNVPIPYKAILFVDSLHYLRSIKRFISDILLQRLDKIVKEHYSQVFNDPNDRDHWSFVDEETIRYIRENLGALKKVLVRAHWADLPQEIREEIEEAFNEKTFPSLLVSTSTLELGIDIPDIWSIIQFRPPIRSDSFIQRIGRAGRSDNTLRTALGVLVLTNQPSDIAYLVDERKSRELFEVLPPKMPKNLIIVKQHIFLSIADFLNIKALLGQLDDSEKIVVNTLFYEPGEPGLKIEQSAKIYSELIRKYKDEIIKYTEQIIPDKLKGLNIEVINRVLADLEKIYEPSSIRESLIKSKSIDDIIEEVDSLRKLLDQLNEKKFEALKQLESRPQIIHVNEDLRECINILIDIPIEDLKKVLNHIGIIKTLIITDRVKDLEEIYEDEIDDIEEYVSQIEDIVEKLNEFKCKHEIDVFYPLLIELRHRLKSLASKIRDNIELREYVESKRKLSQYVGVTNTLSSLLGMYTQNGMYYTSLMTQPLKHVEVKYVSGPRDEPVFLALSRIASLTVDKPIESERLD